MGRRPRLPKPRTQAGRIVELVAIVLLALGIALGLQAWVVKPYRIPSQSMEPTLDVGQRVLVNRFGYHLSDPSIGDVVVFHPPIGADGGGSQCFVQPQDAEACPKSIPVQSSQNFIKRIVAGPGDTLAVNDGHPVVNGVEKTGEPYTLPCGTGGQCNLTKPITVPPDHYFMMGDNRGRSNDSRFWGPVKRDWIIGKAFATYWPPDRIGFGP